MKNLFVKGLTLNRCFYHDIVRPLLERAYPKLEYSASLIGYGSDVLGYDTEISMDHNWGPRLQIFVNGRSLTKEISDYFSTELPFEYRGFPVNYTDPGRDKTQSMIKTGKRPIRHLIEIETFEDYLQKRYNMTKTNNFERDDWLKFTDQNLLEITAGEVYHDGLHTLNRTRKELEFYPLDILKLRLAVLWLYISNKEAFIGRSVELNDIIGLKIQTSRIVNYLIKILFYLERKYIPYSKWFGAAFTRLDSYGETKTIIEQIVTENNINGIEDKLCRLYEIVIEKHNHDHNLPPLDNKIRKYFNRPYKVIFSENIIGELIDSINDEQVKKVTIREYGSDIIADL
jgi:hypothetical protein